MYSQNKTWVGNLKIINNLEKTNIITLFDVPSSTAKAQKKEKIVSIKITIKENIKIARL